MAITLDQLDLSNLASFEQVTRRLIQIGTAVTRNARHPGYAGLDVVFSAPASERGQAATRGFDEWITGRAKERATIWKNTRLYQKEARVGRGGGDAEAYSSSGDGGGVKKKEKFNNKKKEDGKDQGGGGAGAQVAPSKG